RRSPPALDVLSTRVRNVPARGVCAPSRNLPRPEHAPSAADEDLLRRARRWPSAGGDWRVVGGRWIAARAADPWAVRDDRRVDCDTRVVAGVRRGDLSDVRVSACETDADVDRSDGADGALELPPAQHRGGHIFLRYRF